MPQMSSATQQWEPSPEWLQEKDTLAFAVRDRRLSPQAHRIWSFIYIQFKASKRKPVLLTYDYCEKELGIGRKVTAKAIKTLEALGYVQRVKAKLSKRIAGHRPPNCFTPLFKGWQSWSNDHESPGEQSWSNDHESPGEQSWSNDHESPGEQSWSNDHESSGQMTTKAVVKRPLEYVLGDKEPLEGSLSPSDCKGIKAKKRRAKARRPTCQNSSLRSRKEGGNNSSLRSRDDGSLRSRQGKGANPDVADPISPQSDQGPSAPITPPKTKAEALKELKPIKTTVQPDPKQTFVVPTASRRTPLRSAALRRADAPDKSYQLQADGRFVHVGEADNTAISYAMANPQAQAAWLRKQK